MYNIYVKVGNRVFKQTIGIPMGTDCAPLLANLFLFFYEYKYVKDKLRDNHKQAGWLDIQLDTLMIYLRLITPALNKKYLTYTHLNYN